MVVVVVVSNKEERRLVVVVIGDFNEALPQAVEEELLKTELGDNVFPNVLVEIAAVFGD